VHHMVVFHLAPFPALLWISALYLPEFISVYFM